MKIVKGRPSAYETSTDESLQNKKQTLLGDEPQVSFAKTVKLQKRQFSCKAVRQLTKLKWKALLVFLLDEALLDEAVNQDCFGGRKINSAHILY